MPSANGFFDEVSAKPTSTRQLDQCGGVKFIGAFILLLRRHRQEKLPSARLARFLGFVLHNPWRSGCRQACCPSRHLVLFNSSSVGGAINPARDLGPRIMTAMVRKFIPSCSSVLDAVFNYHSQYWIWSPILGSIC